MSGGKRIKNSRERKHAGQKEGKEPSDQYRKKKTVCSVLRMKTSQIYDHLITRVLVCVCACFHEYRGATLSRHSCALDQCYYYFTVIKKSGQIALLRQQERSKLYTETQREGSDGFLHLSILTSSICSRTAYRADSDRAQVSPSNTMNH